MPTGKEARNHAASNVSKTAVLLLDVSSPDGDTDSDWHQVWVFTYPRAPLSNLDDFAAEAKMNTALAGPRATTIGQPQTKDIAGHSFAVTEFEQREPPLVKQAEVFTTICKGQLVSFVLVSNSGSQVKSMEESMKTLDFSGR